MTKIAIRTYLMLTLGHDTHIMVIYCTHSNFAWMGICFKVKYLLLNVIYTALLQRRIKYNVTLQSAKSLTVLTEWFGKGILPVGLSWYIPFCSIQHIILVKLCGFANVLSILIYMYLNLQKKDIYSNLINSFEEFRFVGRLTTSCVHD